MRTLAVILISFFILSMSGCDETKKVIDVAGNVQLSGNYMVTSIDGNTIDSDHPTINFNALDNSVKGNTGCNSFFGKYSIDLYALSFSDIAATEMACGETIMTFEREFMSALRDTGSYSLENGILTFFSKNDRSILLKATKQQNTNN